MSDENLKNAASARYKEWQQEICNYITDILNGNKYAFNQLYSCTEHYVYYCITKHGVPEEAAADIMQKVYMAIYENLGTLRDTNAVVGWIKSIAYHKSMDYFRSEKKEKFIDEQAEIIANWKLEDTIKLPEDILEDKTIQKIIRDLIDKLPEDYKQVIIAYYFDECKIDDIAESLGIPANTVKTRLSRARRKLQESIERLEKEQGIRLHSVSAAPILLLLFHLEAEAAAVPFGISEAVGTAMEQFLGQVPQVSGGVMVSGTIPHSPKAVEAAEAVGTKAVGMTAKRIVIGIVISLLAGAGIIFMMKSKDQTADTTATENATTTEDDNSSSTASEELLTETITSEEQLLTGTTTAEAVTADPERQAQIRQYYHDMYDKICATQQWPDGTDLYISMDIMEALQYTVLDFDQDGYEEFAVSVITADNMAAHTEKLYKYNPDTEECTCILTIYPGAVYYDNGTAWGPSDNSHRFGMDLFIYDTNSGIFEWQVYIFKWARDEWGEQFGDDLLAEVDSDGDGIVWRFAASDNSVSYLEQGEYDAWYQQQVDTAQQMKIPWILFSDGWQYE